MAHRHLMTQSAAREKILRGALALADAVRVTLGPKSKCVLIEKKWGRPLVCNDGVTIAKEIDLEDPYENMGAQLLKEIASKTNDIAGDGTTTATVLGQIIFKEGLKSVVSGVNPMALKRGIKLEPGTRVLVVEDIITTGGSEAIEIAMMTCFDPGDEIIIPEPFYANACGTLSGGPTRRL